MVTKGYIEASRNLMEAVVIPFRETGLDQLTAKIIRLGREAQRTADSVQRLQRLTGGLGASRSSLPGYAMPSSSPASSPGLRGAIQSVQATRAANPLAGGVGAALSALIPEALIAGAAIKVVSDSLQFMTEKVFEFVNAAKSYQSLVTNGGGTLGDARRLTGLANGLGDDPQSIARRFGAEFKSTPYKGDLIRRGINPYRSIYNPNGVNDAADAQTLIKQFLRAPERDAQRMARMYSPLQDFSWARAADPAHQKLLTDAQGLSMSPAEIRRAANAQIEYNLAMADFTKIGLTLGKQLLPAATAALKGFQSALDSVLVVAKIGAAIAGGIPKQGYGMIPGGPNPVIDAAKANTKAQRENTQAIQQLNQSIAAGKYGGGSRAQGALPGGWGIGMYENGWNLAHDLGAFTL